MDNMGKSAYEDPQKFALFYIAIYVSDCKK